jgi:hypothetical protein
MQLCHFCRKAVIDNTKKNRHGLCSNKTLYTRTGKAVCQIYLFFGEYLEKSSLTKRYIRKENI